MSNRVERRKNRMKTRVARLFDITIMTWRSPYLLEAWPKDAESYGEFSEGRYENAVYIHKHGLSYTVTYKRGAMEWTGNNLSDAARMFKALRLIGV